MVFNPVYIQKSNDGETQSFGNSFSNQKPTYLFSDIIKVILAKADQPVDADGKVVGNNSSIAAGTKASENPLLISDSEVELFDQLMKLNSANTNLENLQTEEIAGAPIVLDSLKMYLKGLTNLEESNLQDADTFEIDKSDLLVVLNILAGNIYENNNTDGENEFNLELKDFIKEVEAYIGQLDNKTNQKITIERNDFSVELIPLDNGKLTLKLVNQKDSVAKEEISNKIQSTDSQNILIAEKENFNNQFQQSPTVQSTQKIFVENTETPQEVLPVVNEKTVSNKQVQTLYKVEVKENNVKIDSTPKEVVTASKEEVVDLKESVTASKEVSAASPQIVAASKAVEIGSKENVVKNVNQLNYSNDKTDDKIKIAISDTKVHPNDDKLVIKVNESDTKAKQTGINDNSKTGLNAKPGEVKEFFKGKIKIEVLNVNEDSNKTSTPVKLEAINAAKVTDAQSKIFNLQNVENITQQNPEDANDVLKLKNVLFNQTIKAGEIKAEVLVEKTNESINKNLQQPFSKQVADTKSEVNSAVKETIIGNEQVVNKTLAKEKFEKMVNVKSEGASNSEIKTTETKVEAANSNNKIQSAEYAVVDKKSTTENVNKDNADLEKTIVSKEKSAKAVTSNKETDQQRPENQNQNAFDKTTISINKTSQFGKEIKETIKVVDQSRLMNEIENVIKGSERKLVTLNLYPEELGSVKISLDVNDKVITAKIDVTSDSVRQIILTQAESLKTSLTQSGIQLASLNVSVSNPDEKNSHQGKMKRKDGSSNKKIVMKDIPKGVKIKNLGYNTYDYIV